MKLDARLKGGLAWTGLFVVLAVPSADILFGDRDRAPATTSASASIETSPQTSVVPALKLPVKPSSAAGNATNVASSADPVDAFVKSGKPLPDYISDGDVAPVAVTKPVAPASTPAATDPIEVASLPREVPVPLPRTARPAAPVVATQPAPQAPLIVDEDRVARNTPVEPFPLSEDAPIIEGDQLEEWDSGSLAEYLARNGLLEDGTAPVSEPEETSYDPDGFFLDEGPNRSRVRRLDEDGFFLF